MGIDNVINKLYMLKRLKEEVNSEIQVNLDRMQMDELEKFEFIHKVKKLDLIINNVIKELEENEKQEHTANIDKEELVNKFNIIEESNLSDNDTKKYIPIREEKKNEKEKCTGVNTEKSIQENKSSDEVKSSIEIAYKRIEDLEKLINERKLIEKEELFEHMKNVHSKEEREEMLKKRQIVSESFTPKAKEQSDPEMQKTVAMSKEEFYKEINTSLECEKKPVIKEEPIVNIDHTVFMDKQEIEKQSNLEQGISSKTISDDDSDEYYDIYNEEKSSGIIEKFKDFLGK